MSELPRRNRPERERPPACAHHQRGPCDTPASLAKYRAVVLHISYPSVPRKAVVPTNCGIDAQTKMLEAADRKRLGERTAELAEHKMNSYFRLAGNLLVQSKKASGCSDFSLAAKVNSLQRCGSVARRLVSTRASGKSSRRTAGLEGAS